MAEINHLPQGGHYASWRRVGDWCLTAGIVPRDGQRNLIGNTVQEQTAAVFERLKAVLAETGATLEHVVKVNVYLASLDDMGTFNAEYARQMGDLRPVRTTIGCQLNGIKVEVDAVAYIGDQPVLGPL